MQFWLTLFAVLVVLIGIPTIFYFSLKLARNKGFLAGKEKYQGAPYVFTNEFNRVSFFLIQVYKPTHLINGIERYLIEVSFELGSEKTYLFSISNREHNLLLLEDGKTYGKEFEYLSTSENNSMGPGIQRLVGMHT